MIKGIIFDYGGTIDSNGKHWGCVLWDVYLRLSVPVSHEAFREAYVHGERALARFPYIKPEHTFYDVLYIKSKIQIEWLIGEGKLADTEQNRSYAELIAHDCYEFARYAVSEARKTLLLLNEKYPMVLVSNFYGNIESVLTDFGIRDLFPRIIESAVVGVRKPDPQIFRLGVDELGLKSSEVVVIGDSYDKDIVPALSLGCQTIWLKGQGWTEDKNVIYDKQIIDNFVHLKALLL